MPTITQGNTATGTFGYLDSITVTVANGGSAKFESPTGAVVSVFSGTETLGPYSSQTWTLTAVTGSVFYEVADGNVFSPVSVNRATGGLVDATGAMVSGAGKQLSSLKRGFPVLRCPASLASIPGLGAAGGGGAAPTYQIVKRNGRNALEITYAAHANPATVFWTIPARKYSNRLHYVFEVENAAEWNGGFWGFQYSKDGNFTDNCRSTYNVARNTGWSGLHCVSPAVSEFTFTGTSAAGFSGGQTPENMSYASFRCNRKAAPTGTTRIWLYEVAESETQSLPQIVMGFDDGHMTALEGLAIFEKYGFSSYIAYIRDDQNGTTRMRDGIEWTDAISRGHHAVVHGCKTGINSLADYFAAYAGYASPGAAMRADIEYNRDGMIAAGLDPSGRGRKIYVLPQGLHQPVGSVGDSTIMDAVIGAGMTLCRRAIVEGSILPNGGTKGQALYLPIIGHSYASGGEAANVAAVIASMQTEIANGRSVILMFHEVRAAPTLPEQITPANLELIVAAAAALVQSGVARAGTFYDLADEINGYQAPVHML